MAQIVVLIPLLLLTLCSLTAAGLLALWEALRL